MAVNIKDALDVAVDEKVTILGKVYGKGEIENYMNKQNQKRSYFQVTVADTTAVCKIKVYKNSTESIVIGRTYRFADILRKFGGFWFIGCSRMSVWAPLNISEELEEEAKHEDWVAKECATPNTERKLQEALKSPTTSKVVGKVVQVSPLKIVRNGELAMKFVSLKDDASTVKVALFNQDAETAYNQGDILEITDVYRYNETETLSTKRTAKIQFIGEADQIPDITESDYLKDKDFDFDPEALEKNVMPSKFSVLGINKVMVYACCNKIGCKRKKLVNKCCPYCNETSENSFYCGATIVVEHDGNEKNYTLFYNDLIQIITLPDVNSIITEDVLMQQLLKNLPIYGEAIFDNGHMCVCSQPPKKKK